MENGHMLQVLPASSSAALGESLTWTLSNARRAAQHLDALLRLQTRSLLRLRSPGLKLSDGRHLFHVTPLKPPCDSPQSMVARGLSPVNF